MQKLLMIAVYCLAFIYCFNVAETVIQSHLDPEWPIWPRVVKYKILINGEVFGPDPFLGFSNFRFLNHLHTWSIPIMIGGYLKYNKNLILGFKILSIITLSAWWSLIFASDARGTTLGLLVSLLVIVYSYRREAKDYILYFVLTACAGLIIYFVGFQLFHETGGRTILTRSGDSGRIEVWGTTIQYIIQNPMFGLSPMHFSDIQNSIKFSSPHNMYLLWAAEWGIPALIILLAGAATLFRKWIKYSRENVTNFNISLTASLTAVLVHSNVSGIFISPLSQLLGCFVVAIMLGIYIKDNDVILFSPLNNFKFTRKIMIGGVLIFNIATYSIAISQMSELADSRDQFMIDREETILYPRFWDQGFIDNN